MATDTLTTAENLPTVLAHDRMMLALEAVWEIEVLTVLMLEKAASPEWELDHGPAMLLRSMGVRIKQLSCVAMSAISDPVESSNSLHKEVFGRFENQHANEVLHA